VWTHLPVWVVQTGEVPQLSIGDTWEHLAVRATWSSMRPADQDDGIVPLAADTGETPRYGVTGLVTWTRPPRSLVVGTGSCDLLVEPEAVGRATEPGPNGPPLEPVFPDVDLPHPGERRSFEMTSCSAMLDYEIEAFGYPDVRRDWRVCGIKVEHRELLASPAYPGGSEPGRVLRVQTISRMLRWADAARREHASYLVDVQPL
jgi:hypothetical protein